jgi:PEGA domain
MLLGSLLFFPATLLPQMPPQPGRLVISSDPAGAMVTINGRQMGQRTNATFVVSPGKYRVEVVGPGGNPTCRAIDLAVSAGQTVAKQCSAAGWK